MCWHTGGYRWLLCCGPITLSVQRTIVYIDFKKEKWFRSELPFIWILVQCDSYLVCNWETCQFNHLWLTFTSPRSQTPEITHTSESLSWKSIGRWKSGKPRKGNKQTDKKVTLFTKKKKTSDHAYYSYRYQNGWKINPCNTFFLQLFGPI